MLMRMPRTHLKNLGNTYDTVASHSHHASIISYCIARMEKLSHEEALRVMAMAALHDLHEARTGDFDYAGKNYSKTDEARAIRDTYSNIEFGKDLKEMVDEYEAKKTLASKCAKRRRFG